MRRVFNGRVQILDSNGDPEVGAKLEFFAAGTANNLDTFSDYALTTANTNPVITDSGGWVTIFLTPNVFYDYTTVDSNDVTIYDKELNIQAYEPPLTTKGDIFTYDTDFQRLPVGADGLVLKADSSESTGLVWGTAGDSPLTTKGDLFTYDTDNQRLPVGNNGSILLADDTEATGLKWVDTTLRVTNSATVSLTADTYVTITYDTEAQDSDAIHNTSTYTTTIAVDGWYTVHVFGIVTLNGASMTPRLVWTPNGGSATHLYGNSSVQQKTNCIGDWNLYLTAGDTLYVQMTHTNSTQTLAAGSVFQIRRYA